MSGAAAQQDDSSSGGGEQKEPTEGAGSATQWACWKGNMSGTSVLGGEGRSKKTGSRRSGASAAAAAAWKQKKSGWTGLGHHNRFRLFFFSASLAAAALLGLAAPAPAAAAEPDAAAAGLPSAAPAAEVPSALTALAPPAAVSTDGFLAWMLVMSRAFLANSPKPSSSSLPASSFSAAVAGREQGDQVSRLGCHIGRQQRPARHASRLPASAPTAPPMPP